MIHPMFDIFTDSRGSMHYLNEIVISSEIEHYDRKYARKAYELCKKLKCPVFYNVKEITKSGNVRQSAYFIVPISEDDVTLLHKQYSNCYIGIQYPK